MPKTPRVPNTLACSLTTAPRTVWTSGRTRSNTIATRVEPGLARAPDLNESEGEMEAPCQLQKLKAAGQANASGP